MKLFFIKLLVITTALLVFLNIVVYLTYDRQNSVSAILDKHEILKSTSGRRVIIVGGSGTSFGINSEEIAKSTPYNPVNMGLWAQFGLRFMLEEIKPYVRRGDLVILIPEYYQFYYFFNGHKGLLDLLYCDPYMLSFLSSYKQYLVIAKNILTYLWEYDYINAIMLSFSSNVNSGVYSRAAYNKYGDHVGHWNKESKDISGQVYFNHRVEKEEIRFDVDAISEMNKLKNVCDKIGADVIFLYQIIPRHIYDDNSTYINEVEKEVQAKSNIMVIGSPRDYVLDDIFFYDTVSHLNKSGVDIRTKSIIDLINNTNLPQ